MNVFRHMRHNQFVRDNAVFLMGSVLVGALNYLYYPVLGRLLTPGAFGEVQTLVSLFLQLSVFLVVLSMVVVHIVSNEPDRVRRNSFVFEFEKLALIIGFVVVVMSIVFRTQLQSWLQFTSPWPFVILALAVVTSVPFSLRGGFLRGKQKFGLVASGNMIAAGGKLLLSTLLVIIGLGTIGAIAGVLVAQLIACVLIAVWAFRAGLQKPDDHKHLRLPSMRLLAPELRFGGIVLVASLAITLQYSIDIVLIKHYFDAHTAGLYAGVAAVARILFFLTASIAQVLISKVKMNVDPVKNQQVLRRSLLLLCGVSAPVLLALVFFPSQVIGLLMGSSYQELAYLLPNLSLSVFIVSVLNLLASYHLALRQYGTAIIAAVGAIFTYFIIFLHHGSPSAVVNGLLLGSSLTLVLFGVWKITERRERV